MSLWIETLSPHPSQSSANTDHNSVNAAMWSTKGFEGPLPGKVPSPSPYTLWGIMLRKCNGLVDGTRHRHDTFAQVPN